MKTMKIYEPAMCCSTGLCGASVNPELLRISTVANALLSKGIRIQRFNLSSAPQVFMNNAKIIEMINKEGVECLPITLVDDEIVMSKKYPSNDEIVKLLEIPAEYLIVKKSSCCCGGKRGGCC